MKKTAAQRAEAERTRRQLLQAVSTPRAADAFGADDGDEDKLLALPRLPGADDAAVAARARAGAASSRPQRAQADGALVIDEATLVGTALDDDDDDDDDDDEQSKMKDDDEAVAAADEVAPAERTDLSPPTDVRQSRSASSSLTAALSHAASSGLLSTGHSVLAVGRETDERVDYDALSKEVEREAAARGEPVFATKLEYRDEAGRLLTPKEAWRQFSAKFHGVQPSMARRGKEAAAYDAERARRRAGGGVSALADSVDERRAKGGSVAVELDALR